MPADLSRGGAPLAGRGGAGGASETANERRARMPADLSRGGAPRGTGAEGAQDAWKSDSPCTATGASQRERVR